MKPIDFAAINSALLTDISTRLAQWLPSGVREAHEYVALNPTRNDTKRGSFRINMNSGVWADFATGDKGGDLISLYAYINGKRDQVWAAKELAATAGILLKDEKEKKEDVWEPIIPVPDDIEWKQPWHKEGIASKHWEYRCDGKLLGVVCRFDTSDIDKENKVVKSKITPPATYCKNRETGESKWRWKGFPTPRPLYNQDLLKELPKSNVIIVEGEKTADAVQALFPTQVVITWSGGSKAVKFANWEPLAGRKIVLWPDHDKPGYEAMADVAMALRDKVFDIRYVVNPPDAPEGWDVADSDWTPEQALSYVRENLTSEMAKASPLHGDAQPIEDTKPEKDASNKEIHPFRCLGYDRNYYYYMAAGTHTILQLTLAQHNKAHLMGLATLNFWEREFPCKSGADWDCAVDYMLRTCESIGFFSPALVRGRGAWFDDGRIVVHLGNKVIVDDKVYSPDKVPSTFYYEAGIRMRADIGNPLSNTEATRFASLLEMLPWSKPIDARLLAGWCVCAHIGGALLWRPHAWVIGRKGSGKSHTMAEIVKPIMGDNCFFIQGESTGAGIRQNLGRDSLPVLFDESEGEDENAAQRMQNILSLVRQSSSDTGGIIAKGTPSGKAQNFDIRSCFIFSSINASLVQMSDKSRVTVLELDENKRHTEFEDILKEEADLLTPEYIRKFYARALSLAGIIRANSTIFSKVMAGVFGEQRAGDQMGTLLAGAYSLFSHKIIAYEDAKEWVAAQDWAERKAEVSNMNDEKSLWSFILQQKLRAKVSGGDEEFPIGYLLDIARGIGYLLPDVVKPDAEKAKDILMRNGIKAEQDCVYVANENPYLQRMLRESPWRTNWGQTLKRLPGAYPSDKTIYFGYKGSEQRATVIPF